MRTASELLRLARDSGALWLGCWAPLLGWFSVGYGVNELTGHLSTLLPGQKILGTTIIVFGIVAWVACLVLAIHSVGPSLPGVTGPEDTRLAVLAAALGPFMAVYGAWGLAEEQFERLIQANLMTHGVDADQFSVNAGDWQFFLGFAVAAWVLRLAVRLIARRVISRALVFVGLFADGAWVFASFFVLREWIGRGFDWLTTRAIWQGVQVGWDGFLDVLPGIPIWFQLTLPEGLRLFAARLWDLVVPGLGNAVLLPLMWVALVGTVFGHRSFGAAELVRGTRAEAPTTRAIERGRRLPVARLAALATADLREKYLPMLATLSLLRHAGLRLIGAFLVLVAVVRLAGDGLDRGIQHLIGPRPLPDTLLYSPTTNYLVALLTTTLLLTCYATAFARAVGSRPSPDEGHGLSSIEAGGVEKRK